MSESQGSSGDAATRYLQPGGDNVKLVYVLYLASFVVGVTVIVGLVIAYINRNDTRGTWVGSHYTYQIRTFWIGLLYSFVSFLLMFVIIGFLLFVLVAIWGVVRCVRGLMWAAEGKPVPDPATWLV